MERRSFLGVVGAGAALLAIPKPLQALGRIPTGSWAPQFFTATRESIDPLYDLVTLNLRRFRIAERNIEVDRGVVRVHFGHRSRTDTICPVHEACSFCGAQVPLPHLLHVTARRGAIVRVSLDTKHSFSWITELQPTWGDRSLVMG